jgi:hypothetical protein
MREKKPKDDVAFGTNLSNKFCFQRNKQIFYIKFSLLKINKNQFKKNPTGDPVPRNDDLCTVLLKHFFLC